MCFIPGAFSELFKNTLDWLELFCESFRERESHKLEDFMAEENDGIEKSRFEDVATFN